MSRLSRQFSDAESAEDAKRQRVNRPAEPNYSGAGFWYANYPFMYGTMGTGGMMTSSNPQGETPQQEAAEQSGGGDMAGSESGMGDGGTATGVSGGIG